jgi:hypothetical protein
MNIELEIDELVLHGVPEADGLAVGDAMTRELAALLAARGVPDTLTRHTSTATKDGGAIELRRGAQSRVLAQQVAAAVYRSLEAK